MLKFLQDLWKDIKSVFSSQSVQTGPEIVQEIIGEFEHTVARLEEAYELCELDIEYTNKRIEELKAERDNLEVTRNKASDFRKNLKNLLPE